MLRRGMKRQWARSLPKPLAQCVHRNWQRRGLPQSFCRCDYSRHLHSQAMLSMHVIKMLLSPKGAVGDTKLKKSVNSCPRIVPVQIHILDWIIDISRNSNEIKFRKDIKIIKVFFQCAIHFPEQRCSQRKGIGLERFNT